MSWFGLGEVSGWALGDTRRLFVVLVELLGVAEELDGAHGDGVDAGIGLLEAALEGGEIGGLAVARGGEGGDPFALGALLVVDLGAAGGVALELGESLVAEAVVLDAREVLVVERGLVAEDLAQEDDEAEEEGRTPEEGGELGGGGNRG